MSQNQRRNRRLLLVDDNPAIHEDIRKVLDSGKEVDQSMIDDEALLFGDSTDSMPRMAVEEGYEIDSAYQGQEALELVENALEEKRPYPVAVVDMRMPPGWDGLQTVQKLWEADRRLLIIFCTAFSDYDWNELVETLGRTDSFVFLKKPFDNAEIQQLVAAMVERWHAARDAAINIDQLAKLTKRNAELTREVRQLNEQLAGSEQFPADPSDDSPLSGRVLLLEPDPTERQHAERLLAEAGLEVTALEDPQDALNEIRLADYRGKDIDAIVTEMALPNRSGYDFVRDIRLQGFSQPVIAFTGHERPDDCPQAIAAGCSGYVGKSSGEQTLLALLRSRLDNSHARLA